MAINFPNSPTVGEEYTAGGFTWTWTGSAWEKVSATTAAANDFVLLVGATGNTTYVLDRTYTSGRYTIDFVNDDTTYDIYFIAEDGTYAGYTNNAVAVVTANFSEVVVIGAASNETILFTYQGTATAPSTAGDVATAGAYINSVVTSSLPNIDDSTVVNGGNFAANVQVHFIGQNAAVTAAKTVVRTSSTQLVVTRPDNFAVAQSPYSVRVTNPGIPVPAGSNAHLLSNAVTAGTNPVWVTGTTIFYNVGGATTVTLLATDTEASDIDYTLVSGTLPAGLTLDSETGVISGTFSGSANEGDVTSITVRATDAGGNFLDRTFSFTANTAPTWTTPAGAIGPVPPTGAFSLQLVASTGTAGGALTYSLQSGTLPTGLTLSSSGLISGTSNNTSGTTFNFTVRVTDQGGLFADRSFSALIQEPSYYSTIVTRDFGQSILTNPYDGVSAEGLLASVIGNSDAGYNMIYSFDVGQNFYTNNQSYWVTNQNVKTYEMPQLRHPQNTNRYFAYWLSNPNWPYYEMRTATWERSGNAMMLNNNVWQRSVKGGWSYPAQWGSNVGGVSLIQSYLEPGQSAIAIDTFATNGNISSQNSGIGYNVNSGGGFVSSYGSSRAPWLFFGKSWASGSSYHGFFANTWTNTISSTQYTMTGDMENFGNYLVTENGRIIFYNSSGAGQPYYRITYSGNNPWSDIAAVNGSPNGVFPAGMPGSAKFHFNPAGTSVRVFIANLGVYQTSDFVTWTLTTTGVADDYSGQNAVKVFDNQPATGQESVAWVPPNQANRVVKVGTRTK